MDCSRVPGVRLALVLGLCFAAAANSAAAADAGESVTLVETAAVKAPGLDNPGLDVVKGRAYGVLDGQALDEVLDAFARATGMAYEVDEALGGHPISGRLDGLPASEALVDLLRHFDYMAVWRADGTIERIKVTNLRSAYHEVGGGIASGVPSAAPRVQSAAVGVDEDIPQQETLQPSPTEEELLEQFQVLDLEALATMTGIPIERFYRDLPPGADGQPALDLEEIEEALAQIEDEANDEQ